MTHATRRLPDGVLAAALLAAAAAAVRLVAADAHELWYDDVSRLRLALLSWSAIWTDLPALDNLKSPWLILLHKGWVEAIGTGSIAAIRGFGIACGSVLVALLYLLARRVAGPRIALWMGVATVVSPFLVFWSVEVHNYTPAALAVCGAWIVAMGDARTPGRAALLGALCGLACGIFPPCAAALAPLAMLPGAVSWLRDRRWLCFTAALGAMAVPALHSLWRSQQFFAGAFEGGRGWAPYFHPWRTPCEIALRAVGATPSRGPTGYGTLALVAGGVITAAAALALDPARRDDRAIWRRRVAVVFAGALPLFGLWLVSLLWIGLLTDRYAHTAAVLLPVSLAALLAIRSSLASVLARALVAATCIGLLFGVVSMARTGAAWPKGHRDRGYASFLAIDAIAERTAATPANRIRVYVHGETQTTHALLRSRAVLDGCADLRHLTSAAWVAVRDRGDRREGAIPQPYGWPWGVELAAGRRLTSTVRDIRDDLRAGRTVALVTENPPIRRSVHLDLDSDTEALEALWRAAAEPTDAERWTERAQNALRVIAGDERVRIDVERRGRVVLALLRP